MSQNDCPPILRKLSQSLTKTAGKDSTSLRIFNEYISLLLSPPSLLFLFSSSLPSSLWERSFLRGERPQTVRWEVYLYSIRNQFSLSLCGRSCGPYSAAERGTLSDAWKNAAL